MSRIGRAPIELPAGVDFKVEGKHLTVKGPKGSLEMDVVPEIDVSVEGNVVHVTRPSDEKAYRSLHGLTRTLIHNMVVGVTEGFQKTLEINGVGYRAQKEGKNLVMRRSEPEPGDYQGNRQAEGRPVCSRSSWQASSRALQGQGHQV